MKNIVIDTNVFISALLKSKNCSEILDALKENKFNLVLSEKLITEILIVAGNPKFKFTEREKNELTELILEKCKLINPRQEIAICRDPKDNVVLECAIAGKTDFIVTGDKDLLVFKQFRNISIITPEKFLKIIQRY